MVTLILPYTLILLCCQGVLQPLTSIPKITKNRPSMFVDEPIVGDLILAFLVELRGTEAQYVR
jgi:hypothetical protein